MDQFKTSSNLISFSSIIAAISFLIVIALAVLVLWPMFQELESVWGDIETGKMELQIKQEYVSKLDGIKEQLDEKRTEISRIQTTLPSNPSVPSLFNYLQRVSSEYGLILTEISPFSVSSSSSFTDLRETTFSIKASGSYSSIKDFISSLEKSARLIEVESISLSPGQETAFEINLRLKTFSY